jgi:hypothetical protein
MVLFGTGVVWLDCLLHEGARRERAMSWTSRHKNRQRQR